jgi:hypothetical protein
MVLKDPAELSATHSCNPGLQPHCELLFRPLSHSASHPSEFLQVESRREPIVEDMKLDRS